MSIVLVTGARGTIGSVLVGRLRNHQLRCVDMPDVDLRDPRTAAEAVEGCERVVHLAWDTKAEGVQSGALCLDNAQMTFNMLSASLAAGVRRFVFASSVHAHTFAPAEALVELSGGLLGNETERAPVPDSPYGASKLFGEALCRWAAEQGLETVAIRFGGVNPLDKPPADDLVERSVWLSHRDCAAVVAAALEAKLDRGSATVTAVSNNARRVHSWENGLGWAPRDGAPAATGKLE
jgi:nucleoside-diphosphate-sugar epimerase